MITRHRLTWRGYCAVHVETETREAAIAEAIKRKPLFIPPGTQLYYGIVGGKPVYTVPIQLTPGGPVHFSSEGESLCFDGPDGDGRTN